MQDIFSILDHNLYWRSVQTGGQTNDEHLRDILIYDSTKDEWTKTGDLFMGRSEHALSLVPGDIEEHCI